MGGGGIVEEGEELLGPVDGAETADTSIDTEHKAGIRARDGEEQK